MFVEFTLFFQQLFSVRDRDSEIDGWEGREPDICWRVVVERHGATAPPCFRPIRQNCRMSGTIFYWFLFVICYCSQFGCWEIVGKRKDRISNSNLMCNCGQVVLLEKKKEGKLKFRWLLCIIAPFSLSVAYMFAISYMLVKTFFLGHL